MRTAWLSLRVDRSQARQPRDARGRLASVLGGALVAAILLIAPGARCQTVATQAPIASAPDSSGPEAAMPAPLPPGTADVPGGSSHNGVIKPPPTGSTAAVVQPPGTPANQPNVEPK